MGRKDLLQQSDVLVDAVDEVLVAAARLRAEVSRSRCAEAVDRLLPVTAYDEWTYRRAESQAGTFPHPMTVGGIMFDIQPDHGGQRSWASMHQWSHSGGETNRWCVTKRSRQQTHYERHQPCRYVYPSGNVSPAFWCNNEDIEPTDQLFCPGAGTFIGGAVYQLMHMSGLMKPDIELADIDAALDLLSLAEWDAYVKQANDKDCFELAQHLVDMINETDQRLRRERSDKEA